MTSEENSGNHAYRPKDGATARRTYTMRLRADFWVSAYLRRCNGDAAKSAVLRRRGAPEAGAIYVKLDCLDGRTAVYGPAPQDDDLGERRFIRIHKDEWIDPPDAETRLSRALGFDPDLWIVEVESRDGDAEIQLVER